MLARPHDSLRSRSGRSPSRSSHQLRQAPITLPKYCLHGIELVAQCVTVTVAPLYGGDGIEAGSGLSQRGGNGR